MTKFLTAGLMALTLAAGSALVPTTASAEGCSLEVKVKYTCDEK